MWSMAIFPALYIVGLPLLIIGLSYIHKYFFIIRPQQKNKGRGIKESPLTLLSRMKKPLFYTFKDDRDLVVRKKEIGVQRKKFFPLLWLSGLVFAFASYWIHALFIIAITIFIVTVSWAISSSSKVLSRRRKVYQKIYEIGRKTLGLSPEYESSPESIISIEEWRTLYKPNKVVLPIPATFDQEEEKGFLNLFNQVFGVETTFIPFNETDEEGNIVKLGWDYEEGVLTIKAAPPLPQIAQWHERYINTPGIAWSFFPIALGVEHGVSMVNEETGELEHVLGFDLSGLQRGEGKKYGLNVGPEITTSPMVLIAGGTGGGKAQALTTKVRIRRKKE